MSHVEVLYSRRHGIGSVLLRAFQHSSWSHVGLVWRDTIYEATPSRGVICRWLDDAVEESSRHSIQRLPCAHPERALRAADSQVGRPYDWGGALGIGLRRNWAYPDRWFCSEYVAWCIELGGTPLFRHERVHRVTPEHLWMLAPPEIEP